MWEVHSYIPAPAPGTQSPTYPSEGVNVQINSHVPASQASVTQQSASGPTSYVYIFPRTADPPSSTGPEMCCKVERATEGGSSASQIIIHKYMRAYICTYSTSTCVSCSWHGTISGRRNGACCLCKAISRYSREERTALDIALDSHSTLALLCRTASSERQLEPPRPQAPSAVDSVLQAGFPVSALR